jgi:hypothetical protein
VRYWKAVSLISLIIAAMATTVWFMNRIAEAPGRTLQYLQERLRADYSEQVTFFFQVNRIAAHSEFVVGEIESVVAGEYSDHKVLLGVDMGKTALTYEVPVKFFYSIDMTGAHPVHFSVEEETRTLTATFLGPSVFSVEADIGRLEKEMKVGWGRLDKLSGEKVRADFRERVLSDIKAQGNKPEMLAEIREPARARLTELVRTFMREGHAESVPEIERIQVRFVNESPRLESRPQNPSSNVQRELH